MQSLNRHEDYGQEALKEAHLADDPIEQLRMWLGDAEASEIFEPNAFVLGTAEPDGSVRGRTVLLKGLDHRGLFFASNYLSRKGEALSSNNSVSAVFGWYSIYRQVLVQGFAERVDPRESDEYFASRPHDSQVAAWSSRQSQSIESREALDQQFSAAQERFKSKTVERPDYWGGYRIVPLRVEFWKGRSNRMHDRIEFERTVSATGDLSAWQIQRLQP